jgi:hypothetical protein
MAFWLFDKRFSSYLALVLSNYGCAFFSFRSYLPARNLIETIGPIKVQSYLFILAIALAP